MGRTKLFGHHLEDHQEGQDLPDLAGTTQPDAEESVRAVIDLALLGGPGDGKTELAATLIRTLRARAPELGPLESADNRRALAAVMGGRPADEGDGEGDGEGSDRMAHYTFRVPLLSLFDMLGGLSRAALLWRTGRLAVPLWPTLFLAGGAIGAALNLPLPLALLPPLAAIAIVLLLVGRALRAGRDQVARAGDVELVIWDPPGERIEGERAAELYDRWAQLSRRRRANQPGWRAYSFVPILLTNPLRFSRDGAGVTARLRGLLPMFAALAGQRPRAVVAINRWNLVTAACPPGSPKTEAAAVRDGDGDEVIELDRAALTSACIEAEDGRDGGLSLIHLRYDAGDARADRDGDVLRYRGGDSGAVLEGASRRAIAELLAELALDGPVPRALPEPPPAFAPVEPAPRPEAPPPVPAAPVAPVANADASSDNRPTAVFRARTAAPVEPYDYRDNEYIPVPASLAGEPNNQNDGEESPYQPRGATASETLRAMTEALDDSRANL